MSRREALIAEEKKVLNTIELIRKRVRKNKIIIRNSSSSILSKHSISCSCKYYICLCAKVSCEFMFVTKIESHCWHLREKAMCVPWTSPHDLPDNFYLNQRTETYWHFLNLLFPLLSVSSLSLLYDGIVSSKSWNCVATGWKNKSRETLKHPNLACHDVEVIFDKGWEVKFGLHWFLKENFSSRAFIKIWISSFTFKFPMLITETTKTRL